jgi:hypothetical protein
VNDLNKVYKATILPAEPVKAFVGDDGIYIPSRHDFRFHEMLISKELFVEAYNKWIKNDAYVGYDRDDADCWCE